MKFSLICTVAMAIAASAVIQQPSNIDDAQKNAIMNADQGYDAAPMPSAVAGVAAVPSSSSISAGASFANGGPATPSSSMAASASSSSAASPATAAPSLGATSAGSSIGAHSLLQSSASASGTLLPSSTKKSSLGSHPTQHSASTTSGASRQALSAVMGWMAMSVAAAVAYYF
ncbi:hypothetical protein VTP01DRAFT_9795 [Rhizomucor pusillus]|uniref:uncharacterized protein n=1 Tax=Rhizomucor pusillus TaxID=4840 RepID=UPI003743C36C